VSGVDDVTTALLFSVILGDFRVATSQSKHTSAEKGKNDGYERRER